MSRLRPVGEGPSPAGTTPALRTLEGVLVAMIPGPTGHALDGYCELVRRLLTVAPFLIRWILRFISANRTTAVAISAATSAIVVLIRAFP